MTPDPSPAAELLRAAVGRVGLAAATDGELVRRFATHHSEGRDVRPALSLRPLLVPVTADLLPALRRPFLSLLVVVEA